MNRIRVSVGMVCLSLAAWAQQQTPPTLAGKWELNVARSRNIGMMAEMKMTSTIKQTPNQLVVSTVTNFKGRDQTSELEFDLSGKPTTNKSPMEAPAETISKWEGDHLVTTWTSEGSIAGTKNVRTETRYLTDGGRTLVLESRRGNSAPLVMVYDRK